jgi:hypothetical protein
LVKSIETLPALAVSEVVLYLSWPSWLASRLKLLPPLAAAGLAAVEVLAELDSVVGVAALAGVDAEELVVLLELPHPTSTNSPAIRARIETVGIERLFVAPERVAAAPTVLSLISQILHWFGAGL